MQFADATSNRLTALPALKSAAPAPRFRAVLGRVHNLAPFVANAWDDLAAEAAESSPFAERWFVSASRPLAQDGDIRLLQLWDGDQLAAVLPVHVVARYGRLPMRHVENWQHYHCFVGTPLLRRGQEVLAWTAILKALDSWSWASGLLHLTGVVEDGPSHQALRQAATQLGRRCDTVHRIERAMLASDLSPMAYYEAAVRGKKRKEIKRLQSRLQDMGIVSGHRLSQDDDVASWCNAFLSLERSGWKGQAGTALACSASTERFFRDAIHGAHAAGRLEMLRLDVGERPIAMMVNFIAPPGAFSFKIAYDETFARFSPGVLIQLENLSILDRRDVAWMDSCAVENHPMIGSLWKERRSIIRVTLPLAGHWRAAQFSLARMAELGFSALKAVARRKAPLSSRQAVDHG